MLLPDSGDYGQLLTAAKNAAKDTGAGCSLTDILLLGLLERMDELIEVLSEK